MNLRRSKLQPDRIRRGGWAFTLVEVMTSMAIAGTAIGGVIAAYALAARYAEWSTASAAAHRSATSELERWRSARWDGATNEYPLVSTVYVQTTTLDLAQTGTTTLSATNRTTITPLSTAPPLVRIHSECVWSLPGRGPFTNEVVTYRAPDQ